MRPENRRERFLIGKKHGLKRAKVFSNYSALKVRQRDVNLLRDTTKLCSCRMCGNQRRHSGEVTRQELEQKIADKEE
jgi:hypothetical protein